MSFRANTLYLLFMKSTFDSAEIDLLTSKLIDQLLTDDESIRLFELLNTDSTCRSRYSYLMLQESLLHWEESDALFHRQPTEESAKIISFSTIISLAASIVILASVWFGYYYSDERAGSENNILLIDDILTQSSVNQSSPYGQNSAFNSSRFSMWFLAGINSEDANSEAIRGIEILENEESFADGGLIMVESDIASWNRQEYLSVPAEMGVLPYRGDRMIKFSEMEVNVDAQSAEVSETIQVLDLRKLHDVVNKGEASFDAEVHFNQGVGPADDSTEFSLSFHAISGGLGLPKRTLAHKQNPLKSDVSPQTWEKLETEFAVPEGTDFVVVALSAKKFGSDALVSNLTGYYADQLNLNLSIGKEDKIGPL